MKPESGTVSTVGSGTRLGTHHVYTVQCRLVMTSSQPAQGRDERIREIEVWSWLPNNSLKINETSKWNHRTLFENQFIIDL